MIKRILFVPLLFIAFNAWAIPPWLDDAPPDVELTKEQKKELKDNLKGKIFKRLIPARNDYVNRYDRGTVFYMPDSKQKNYSRHKFIANKGEIISGKNFMQTKFRKISDSKNLVIRNSNMVNVDADPTWTLIDCNTTRARKRIKSVEVISDGYRVIIEHQAYREGVWVTIDEEMQEPNEESYQKLLLKMEEQEQ